MASYFVSYAYFIPRGSHGFGNIEVEYSMPIARAKDIEEITSVITDAVCRTRRIKEVSITILNWREFEPDIDRTNESPTRLATVVKFPSNDTP